MELPTKEIAQIKTEVSSIELQAHALIVDSQEAYLKAGDMFSQLKKINKMVKERKEKITKPLNEGLKSARELFKPIESTCEIAEDIIQDKMLSYKRQVDEEARQKEQKLADRVDRGTMRVDTAAKKMDEIERVDTTVRTDHGAVQTRKVKKVIVTDEELVPLRYRVLDMVAIRRDALAGIIITGVKVIEEETLAGIN